jgi:dipeptidyl aminopeptidase/acylaminoacyl peptidase
VSTRPGPPDRGIWYALWTATKLTVVVIICAAIAVFMLTSTDSTVTPAAPITASPTPIRIVVGLPTPTSVPIVRAAPQDAQVPGHLYFVKGSTIYKLHGADPPVPIADGRQPALSPDGRQLAYVLFQHNYQDLYTLNMRTDAGARYLNDSLTDPTDQRTGKSVAEPAWSTDGQYLFFSWSYPGAIYQNTASSDFSITRCPAAGPCGVGTATQISTPDFESGGDYDAAPRPKDPTILVYTKYVYQENSTSEYFSIPRLVSRNLTTGGEVDLTPPLVGVSNPAWNPTGRNLTFVKTSDDQQHTNIWEMPYHPVGDPQDFKHAHLLVRGNPFASYPVFSPDGHYLAFIQTGDDGRLHLYIGLVHLGKHPSLDHVQQVKRAGVVDGGERLAWGP